MTAGGKSGDPGPADVAHLPVYLIHWNAPEWCASSVTSIARSEGLSPAITVIDNGQASGPCLESLVPAGTRVVATRTNLGYTGGANAALMDWYERYPDGDYCVVASHDLQVQVDTLALLLDAARQAPGFGILAPFFVAPFNVKDGPFRRIHGIRGDREAKGPATERTWLSGSCLLLSRPCIDRIGGFDERFGSYVEDVDLCLRAWDAGWRVGCVTAARASGLGSAISTPEVISRVDVNNVLLAAKRGGLRFAGVAAGLVGYFAARAALASSAPWRGKERRHQSRLHLKGHALGLGLAVSRQALIRQMASCPEMHPRLAIASTVHPSPAEGRQRTS